MTRPEEDREYLDYLSKTPEEFNALLRDLTIQVTEFFREPEIWKIVAQKVLPMLPLETNIWSAGCATGEEAYSLAILVEEEGSMRYEGRTSCFILHASSLSRFGKPLKNSLKMQIRGRRFFGDNFRLENSMGDATKILRNREREGGSMVLNKQQKESLRQELVDCLHLEREIIKIVIFGSFLHSNSPHDLDVAVFQDSSESYLPLAMKYRKRTRAIAKKIPMDIVPLKMGVGNSSFLSEVDQGEVIYER